MPITIMTELPVLKNHWNMQVTGIKPKKSEGTLLQKYKRFLKLHMMFHIISPIGQGQHITYQARKTLKQKRLNCTYYIE